MAPSNLDLAPRQWLETPAQYITRLNGVLAQERTQPAPEPTVDAPTAGVTYRPGWKKPDSHGWDRMRVTEVIELEDGDYTVRYLTASGSKGADCRKGWERIQPVVC